MLQIVNNRRALGYIPIEASFSFVTPSNFHLRLQVYEFDVILCVTQLH